MACNDRILVKVHLHFISATTNYTPLAVGSDILLHSKILMIFASRTSTFTELRSAVAEAYRHLTVEETEMHAGEVSKDGFALIEEDVR
jgi:hypothetical protein